MAERVYTTFAEFWPYYVREHSKPGTRALHVIGTAFSFVFLALLIATWSTFPNNLWWLLAGLVVGYGFAWIGHFVVEKNRPATFTYPLWSLRGDYKMFVLTLTGRMRRELDDALAKDAAT